MIDKCNRDRCNIFGINRLWLDKSGFNRFGWAVKLSLALILQVGAFSGLHAQEHSESQRATKQSAIKQRAIHLSGCIIQAPIPGAKATGAYVTINYQGSATIALVGAAFADLAARVEIHEMTMKNGTMSMQAIDKLTLNSGDTQLKKGGYHVMIMGLQQELLPNETYTMTLMFDQHPPATCEAVVKSVADIH